MPDMIHLRLLQEGRAAFERGLGKTRCPYELGTPECRAWLEGWIRADIEDSAAVPSEPEPARRAI